MSFLSGLKRSFTSRSSQGSGSNSRSQGSGSNSGSETSLPLVRGTPPPAIEPLEPSPPVEPILWILEQQEHIISRSEEERNRIAGLAEREFQHSRVFDPQLLHAIGLLGDFENALRYTHLADFYSTAELGSCWQAIEFLASLEVDTTGGLAKSKFKFHLFNQDFTKTDKEMSNLLGFKPSAPTNIDSLPNFNEQAFWVKIAGHDAPKRRTGEIHNPSLRVLHQIDMPEPKLSIYRSTPILLLDLKKAEPARNSIVRGPSTRARTRARNQGPAPEPAPMPVPEQGESSASSHQSNPRSGSPNWPPPLGAHSINQYPYPAGGYSAAGGRHFQPIPPPRPHQYAPHPEPHQYAPHPEHYQHAPHPEYYQHAPHPGYHDQGYTSGPQVGTSRSARFASNWDFSNLTESIAHMSSGVNENHEAIVDLRGRVNYQGDVMDYTLGCQKTPNLFVMA
ncbi:hypothetical protein EJB05_14082, partial [Eragrostis curvula]